MTNKDVLTKRIAEVARDLCGKIDAMDDLMGTSLHEYFLETSMLDGILYDLLEIAPGDHSRDIVSDYTNGSIEYVDMLSQIQVAKDTFDYEGYAEFLRMQEESYGGITL